MKESFVTSLTPEEPIHTTFLIQSKERKIARNGNPYLDLELRDATGVIRAKLWDCDRHVQEFDVDDVVRVVGEVENFQGTPQIRVRKISRCTPEEIDLGDYFPRSSRDPEEMYAALLGRVRELPPGPVGTLLLAVLEDPAIAERFKLAPAAMSYHHAYLGGLVEHVLSLVELADQVCGHYASLRNDLVVAGLVLHDLGKIEELSYTRGFRYTTRGKLVGHISIGLEIVRGKMRQIADFPADLGVQIEHIILSHHGQLEFGSPKEPMFPEALVVHYLDDLDSKLASMRAQYAADKDRPGEWTSRNPALKRELLKPPID
ncbi:MAG TPA: HD domain-containing protein [Terriglobia bacterium]|nr:HD domain-containing protein [Terriglobia bacterium]